MRDTKTTLLKIFQQAAFYGEAWCGSCFRVKVMASPGLEKQEEIHLCVIRLISCDAGFFAGEVPYSELK